MRIVNNGRPRAMRRPTEAIRRYRRAAAIAFAGGLLALSPAAANAEGASYVAMGDSYTAAPGVLPVAPGSFPLCFQSAANYPHLVAAALNLSLTDVSCSGARTANFTKSQFNGLAPQFSALGASTEVVTVGMGGNDGGLFGALVKGCTALDFGQPNIGAPCQEHFESFVATTRETFKPIQEAALAAIHELAPNAKVFVVGYPDITPSHGFCPEAMPWTTGDLRWFRNLVQIPGNETLRQEAQNTNAVFVDLLPHSIGHDVCQPPGVRWIEPLFGSLTGVAVHPNATGEEQDALRVEKAMVQNGVN